MSAAKSIFFDTDFFAYRAKKEDVFFAKDSPQKYVEFKKEVVTSSSKENSVSKMPLLFVGKWTALDTNLRTQKFYSSFEKAIDLLTTEDKASFSDLEDIF